MKYFSAMSEIFFENAFPYRVEVLYRVSQWASSAAVTSLIMLNLVFSLEMKNPDRIANKNVLTVRMISTFSEEPLPGTRYATIAKMIRAKMLPLSA